MKRIALRFPLLCAFSISIVFAGVVVQEQKDISRFSLSSLSSLVQVESHVSGFATVTAFGIVKQPRRICREKRTLSLPTAQREKSKSTTIAQSLQFPKQFPSPSATLFTGASRSSGSKLSFVSSSLISLSSTLSSDVGNLLLDDLETGITEAPSPAAGVAEAKAEAQNDNVENKEQTEFKNEDDNREDAYDHMDDSALLDKIVSWYRSSVSTSAPPRIMELAEGFKQVYDDLKRPSLLDYNVSDTIRFSYVTPPIRIPIVSSTGTTKTTTTAVSTWNNPIFHSVMNQRKQKRNLSTNVNEQKQSPLSMLLPKELRPDVNKPLAIYLPGMDGYGISACRNQFDDLSYTFELWRLVVHGGDSDRTSFHDMVKYVTEFIIKLSSVSATTHAADVVSNCSSTATIRRPIVLIGESFGGLLAAAVAIRLQQEQCNLLDGLVLVNPATSFDQTPWDILVPALTLLDVLDRKDSNNNAPDDIRNSRKVTPYGVAGSIILSLIIPDQSQTQALFTTVGESIADSLRSLSPTSSNRNGNNVSRRTIFTVLDEYVNLIMESFQTTEKTLPAELLRHRVMNWVKVGSDVVNENLYRIVSSSDTDIDSNTSNTSNAGEALPILFVSGEQDALLPSSTEATRFLSLSRNRGNGSSSSNVEILRVKQRGHFVLDASVNLTEAIVYSTNIGDKLQKWKEEMALSSLEYGKDIDDATTTKRSTKTKYSNSKAKRKYDPITDWTVQPDIDQYISTTIKPYRDVFSPIFISTDSRTGKRWMGLSKLPSSSLNTDTGKIRRPILFVGNHQLFALDMQLYVSEIYEQRGMFLRGLAHPITFGGEGGGFNNFGIGDGSIRRPFDMELRGRVPGLVPPPRSETNNRWNIAPPPNMGTGENSFENFGAVVVTPKNYYRLLENCQNVLLFPGGARELYSGDTSYPLKWPTKKTDFVRTAARFNATIVPFSAVGMVDSFNLLLEPKDLLEIPVIGDQFRKINSNISAARYDENNEDEVIGLPVALPTFPKRNYYLFGRPIDTTNIDPSDKAACAEVYATAQNEVRKGLDDLLKAREQDPFGDTIRRVAYEQFFQKKAPTFPIEILNQ